MRACKCFFICVCVCGGGGIFAVFFFLIDGYGVTTSIDVAGIELPRDTISTRRRENTVNKMSPAPFLNSSSSSKFSLLRTSLN